MKPYLLALSLLLASISASAQHVTQTLVSLPVDPATRQITYSRIIAIPGATKDELYTRGKIWFATAFHAAQGVTLADDQQAGLLVGQGVAATRVTYGLLLPLPNLVVFKYTIKLSFKDGEYRYILTDFQFQSGQPFRFDQELSTTDYLAYHLLTDFKYNSQYGQFNGLIPLVERVCLARRPDGRLTKRAAKFSKGLDRVAQHTVTRVESGMSQAAGGSGW